MFVAQGTDCDEDNIENITKKHDEAMLSAGYSATGVDDA
jgi:hypothetical protein